MLFRCSHRSRTATSQAQSRGGLISSGRLVVLQARLPSAVLQLTRGGAATRAVLFHELRIQGFPRMIASLRPVSFVEFVCRIPNTLPRSVFPVHTVIRILSAILTKPRGPNRNTGGLAGETMSIVSSTDTKRHRGYLASAQSWPHVSNRAARVAWAGRRSLPAVGSLLVRGRSRFGVGHSWTGDQSVISADWLCNIPAPVAHSCQRRSCRHWPDTLRAFDRVGHGRLLTVRTVPGWRPRCFFPFAWWPWCLGPSASAMRR
mmetsp:Transcript_32172/g.83439  ORF Transcript_32172/g.83439 Transcript_32172/m.83439 type:complete len:260 (-) Transcript_32172:441-1220(-)